MKKGRQSGVPLMVMLTEHERMAVDMKAKELGLTLRALTIAAINAYVPPPSPKDYADRISELEQRMTSLEQRICGGVR